MTIKVEIKHADAGNDKKLVVRTKSIGTASVGYSAPIVIEPGQTKEFYVWQNQELEVSEQ